jgi:hypothetical protein
MQELSDRQGAVMKRILCIILGLIVMLALPLAGEAVAPTAPVPDPIPANYQQVTSKLALLPSVIPEPTAEPELPARYILTPEERAEIEMTVMAEAGGECWEGQLAVAQCILNAAELEGIRPTEVLTEYKYTSRRIEPSESVREAVSAVFDRGEVITSEPITLFYAPAIVYSKWHEAQEFVIELGGHRFFR